MVTGDDSEQQDRYDNVYNNLSEVSAPRDDVGAHDIDISESMSQRMKMSTKMSDTQVVDKRLFPELKEDWLSNLMVARIFLDTFNPLRNIIAKHLLQEYPDMSVAEAIAQAEVALTVPLDGEGRLDIIHLFSKLSENNEKEKRDKLA